MTCHLSTFFLHLFGTLPSGVGAFFRKANVGNIKFNRAELAFWKYSSNLKED